MRLSQNFDLAEFELSQTAKRMGIVNSAPESIHQNLYRLAECLQVIRNAVKVPIIITSGYRCKELNKAVGGVEPSSHESGLAADIIITGYTPLQTCLACIRHATYFHKIIYEFDGWCHFEIGKTSTFVDNHHKTLTIDRRGTQWGFIVP